MGNNNAVVTTVILALVLVATTFLTIAVVESGALNKGPTVVVSDTVETMEPSSSPSNTPAPIESPLNDASSVPGIVYVVKEGDDLRRIASEFYGDADLFPAIVWATTLQAAHDPAYAINTENNELETGQPIIIPDVAQIDAWERQFQQANRLHNDVLEASLDELQAAMADGSLTSVELVDVYLDRIASLNHNGPHLNAVIEVNPDALEIARALDIERANSGPRSLLHGIPVLLKDNIDTADQMQTTAGSVTLLGSKPAQDAFVVQKLREAGAVILGKANLSEWANFRGNASVSGWSGRGGLTRNPYRLDFTPWGSSSGSGSAVAANLTAVALGTETAGSISAPASITGIVGLKPTVGLTSRSGVIPIAHSYDTVGPMTRTVTDAALVLSAIAGVDARDPATTAAEGLFTNYAAFLDEDGLSGMRIGVPVNLLNLNGDEEKEALFQQALDVMQSLGATVIEVEMPGLQALIDWFGTPTSFGNLLRYEFKSDIAQYLANRIGVSQDHFVPRTLADLVELNEHHADIELSWFGQELFVESLTRGGLDEIGYLEGLYEGRRLAGRDGIDALLLKHNLDTLVLPALESFARIYAALPGYPLLTVPAAFTQDGLPFSIGFFGSAFDEPVMIQAAFAFEQATLARRPPQYLLSVRDAYNHTPLISEGKTTFSSQRAYVHWLTDSDDGCAKRLKAGVSCTSTLIFDADGGVHLQIEDAIYLGKYEVGEGLVSVQLDVNPGVPPVWLFSLSPDGLTLKDLEENTIWLLAS